MPLAMQTKSMTSDDELGSDRMALLQREVALLKQALALLGLNPCSQCGKYFRSSDRGARFDGGEPICIRCLEHWWIQRRERLPVREREVVERKLLNWLVSYHRAEVVKRPVPNTENPDDSFCLVANCPQCDGSGQAGGRRCSACDGRGSVWVVVPRQAGGPVAPDK